MTSLTKTQEILSGAASGKTAMLRAALALAALMLLTSCTTAQTAARPDYKTVLVWNNQEISCPALDQSLTRLFGENGSEDSALIGDEQVALMNECVADFMINHIAPAAGEDAKSKDIAI